MAMNVPFHRPYIDEQEIEAVARAMRRQWIGFGPMVSSFEKEFALRAGAPHAVAVNSCTAALHLAVEAFDIGPGDEVITTPLTFSATILAILYAGAVPVLADIDERTLCMDPQSVREHITERTKAILPVHYGGYPCDMDKLISICREHQLVLIEDAAHAALTRWAGQPIGSGYPGIRSAACFSFHSTKTISIGDGGMITTADERAVQNMTDKRLFGMRKMRDVHQQTDLALHYEVVTKGYKYNMTDLEAAIGRVQLRKLDEIEGLLRKVAARYYDRLHDIPDIVLPEHPEEGTHGWHLYVIRVPRQIRDELLVSLAEHGIKASIHFRPVYRFPYFQTYFPNAAARLTVIEQQADRLISLPIFPGMTEEEVEYVAHHVRQFMKSNSGVNSWS
jgi:dTDP-4-amino-4,6-dideoxygalactose transaminase